MVLLDQALHGGRAGRTYRELVLEKQIAVEADGGVDDVFGYNGPAQMSTRILHKPEYSAEQTLAAFDAVFARYRRRELAGRTGATESEMAVRLLLDTRRWPRWIHAALWADAFPGMLHAFRQSARIGEHDSGWIPGGEARRNSGGGEEIFAARKPRHRLPDPGQ